MTIEERVRALIARIENMPLPPTDGPEDHWFNAGLDEAYDNVLDRLYSDVLGEER